MTPSFDAFIVLVAARLEQGRKTYGDRSFSRSPAELTEEIEEELLDVCAWSFILWSRLHAINDFMARELTGQRPEPRVLPAASPSAGQPPAELP